MSPSPSVTLAFLKKLFSLKEILWLFSLVSSGVILGGLAIYFLATPSVATIADFPHKETSILYDRTGTHELYRFFEEENRIVITHDEIPDTIRQATIATEDKHFYSHQGVDPRAVIRALYINYQSGKIEQGASTITQQLARNLYLTRERTITRKMREAFLALKIDQNFSKDQILDLYLNTVPYGANAYGIEAAAQTYFGKHAKELSVDESALLAALPNAPTTYSPYQRDTSHLVARQKDILHKMRALGYVGDDELEEALNVQTLAKIEPLQRSIAAPHFVFYVLDELVETYGIEKLQTGGLRIHSTLDFDLQQQAERAVKEGAERNARRRANNAALVAVNPQNGDILAMVGSKDYFDERIDGNVNVTTRARQPGSAFKPFAYAKAFEKGYQPETLLIDTAINFGPDGSGRNYIPRNYDGRYHGVLSMRQALAMSLNIPAVETLALAGVHDTIELARRMGITTLTDPNRYGLALVLGGAEVRPLDMASAFGAFGQDGVRHPVSSVTLITDTRGNVITFKRPAEGLRVLNEDIARKINAILSDNQARTPIFGPNSPLAFPASTPVAAKTGTTQNFRDAWTVGYTPSIAVAVWAGNNDNRPMAPGSDGVFVAAPIWRDFMNAALDRFPETGFVPYEKNNRQPEQAVKFAKTKVEYYDKKSGKKISEKKAKKMDQSRVEIRHVPVIAKGDKKKSDGDSGPVSFEAIRKSYEQSKKP